MKTDRIWSFEKRMHLLKTKDVSSTKNKNVRSIRAGQVTENIENTRII